MQTYLVNAVGLALMLAVGAGVIVMTRAWWMGGSDDSADWEKTLVGCKKLRDEGVLSDQEYRNIRTLVEPRTRIGVPAPGGRQQPSAERDRDEAREGAN